MKWLLLKGTTSRPPNYTDSITRMFFRHLIVILQGTTLYCSPQEPAKYVQKSLYVIIIRIGHASMLVIILNKSYDT